MLKFIIYLAYIGCKITACQRTFPDKNTVCQGIVIFAWTKCLDKVSGKLNQELLEIDNHIYNYKNFSTMSRQFYLCPWKLYHALTVCQPIFQKLFRTLIQKRYLN